MTVRTIRVVAAGFTPVKGTRHLTYDRIDLDHRGPIGDRAYCLVDIGSRRVLRTVQNPALIAVSARPAGPRLTVTLPDGRSATAAPVPTGDLIACDYWGRRAELELLDGPHSALLSDFLGAPVRLAAAPRGAVVFGDPVTMISLGSLRDLAGRADWPRLADQAGRFRATVVADTGAPAYAEDDWTGREVSVGGARLRIGAPIPRCAVIDLNPATGRRDARLLKTLASHRPTNAAGEPCFGVYAQVVSPGPVLR